MDVGGKLIEIESLDKELAILKIRVTEFKNRRNALLEELISYHREKGVESFEYKGKKYNIKEKTVAARKKDKDKERDALKELEKHGLYGADAKSVYLSVLETMKGKGKTKCVLK
jgi:hypothetical protein